MFIELKVFEAFTELKVFEAFTDLKVFEALGQVSGCYFIFNSVHKHLIKGIKLGRIVPITVCREDLEVYNVV